MSTVTSFDTTKYRLGPLCKRGHDWSGTGQSLRLIGRSNCLMCNQAKLKRPGLRLLSAEQRFWALVDKSDSSGCWVWQGVLKGNGYGGFSITQQGQKKGWFSHRYAWTIVNGEIPDGLLVCHHCDNRRCCNPAHLFLGTASDNMQDMIQKGRKVNGRAKLNEQDVVQIRTAYANGNHTMRGLARMYQVDKRTIQKIIHRQAWKNI